MQRLFWNSNIEEPLSELTHPKTCCQVLRLNRLLPQVLAAFQLQFILYIVMSLCFVHTKVQQLCHKYTSEIRWMYWHWNGKHTQKHTEATIQMAIASIYTFLVNTTERRKQTQSRMQSRKSLVHPHQQFPLCSFWQHGSEFSTDCRHICEQTRVNCFVSSLL